jgi:hypothetical protein
MDEQPYTEYLQETIDFSHTSEHYESISVEGQDSEEIDDADILFKEYEESGEDPDEEIDNLLVTLDMVTQEMEGKGDGLFGGIIHSDKYRVI